MNLITDTLSDKDLVDLILNEDRQAASLLIRRTEKLVAQIVFKMVGNHSERKDLTQDIYLKTFWQLPRFRFQCKLSTWVAQISYHTCLDHLKNKRPELLEDLPETVACSADSGRQLMLRETKQILEQVSAGLPPLYNTLISLFHKEELSIEEIIEITGMPAGTVKNYLFRGRIALKEKILKFYKKEDL